MSRPFLLTLLSLVAVAVGTILIGWRLATDLPARPEGGRRDGPEAREPTLVGRGEARPGAGPTPDPAEAPGPEAPGGEDPAASRVRVGGRVFLRREGLLVPSGDVVVLADPPPTEGGEPGFHRGRIRRGLYVVVVPRGSTLRAFRVEHSPWPEEAPACFLETEIATRPEVLDADLSRDLEVDPGVVVAGRVLSEATGAGVAGARVTLLPETSPPVACVAGPDGRYLLAGIPPDVLSAGPAAWVEAMAPGYGRARVPLPPGALERGREEGLDLVLRSGARLLGRVAAPEGRSIEGVRVFAWVPRAPEIGLGRRVHWLGETVVDQAQAFDLRLAAAPPDATVEVQGGNEWGAGQGVGARLDGVDLAAAGPRVEVTLPASVRLFVGATFPDGRLVAGPDLVVAFRDEAGVPRSAQVQGKTGRYLEVAPGRTVDLHLHATRRGDGGRTEHFAGRAGATAPDSPEDGYPALLHLTVPLEPWSPPPVPPGWWEVRSLGMNAAVAAREHRLTFLDATTGAAIAGRSIRFRASGGTSGTALGPDGRVRLALGPGRTFLHVEVDGYEPETLLLDILEPGAEEAEVRLTPLR